MQKQKKKETSLEYLVQRKRGITSPRTQKVWLAAYQTKRAGISWAYLQNITSTLNSKPLKFKKKEAYGFINQFPKDEEWDYRVVPGEMH